MNFPLLKIKIAGPEQATNSKCKRHCRSWQSPEENAEVDIKETGP